MLSSVLNSPRAISVNIAIMRTFARIREFMLSNVELKRKIDALEKRYDQQFAVVFEAIRKLLDPGERKIKGPIGFQPTKGNGGNGRGCLGTYHRFEDFPGPREKIR